LLDWLASDSWRGLVVKAMHADHDLSRLPPSSLHPTPAVASSDPEQTSIAVFRSRRLAAEELRDAILAVTGELNPPRRLPVRPELNPRWRSSRGR